MSKRILYFAFVAIFGLLVVSAAGAYDRTEADNCADCHNPNMAFVMETWLDSDHAESFHDYSANTYCAACHTPMEADAEATHSVNEPVSLADWQAVTCAACHPPHNLRVEWKTPIGLYNIAANTDPSVPDYGYTKLTLEDSDLLCIQCHSGARHEKDFQGLGNMHKKDVRCVDCHMALIPSAVEGKLVATHDFKVGAHLPSSCGTYEGGCHDNHSEAWAAKQIAKNKMHGKEKHK